MSRDSQHGWDPQDPGISGDRFPDDRPPSDRLPEATVSRLPVYLRVLTGMAERGIVTVSSDQLATGAGVNSAKLRKDLSHLGSYGIRGVGYDVEYLIYQVSRALGLTQEQCEHAVQWVEPSGRVRSGANAVGAWWWGCRGFWRIPAAEEAAIPIAVAIPSRSRPSSLATAAPAATVPAVLVACQPPA